MDVKHLRCDSSALVGEGNCDILIFFDGRSGDALRGGSRAPFVCSPPAVDVTLSVAVLP